MASEGYSIKLRNRRSSLEIDREELRKLKYGKWNPRAVDLFGRTMQQLEDHIASEERVISIMEGY